MKAIQFAANVQFEKKSVKDRFTFQNNSGGLRRSVPKSVVYADLERDIFCFDYCAYSRYSPSEWFCFFRKPISSRRPRRLPKDHWIFSVREIALTIPKYTPLSSEWDKNIFKHMKQLKEVRLVTSSRYYRGHIELLGWSVYGVRRWNTRRQMGFKDASQPIGNQRFPEAHSHGLRALNSMRRKCRKYGITANLTIVADMAMWWN
ncbi:hypothetical protein F4804DRAFT_317691 [Jackrogersella minutella]|nr:hypothetical protein F4804DRAFT_317691 [Jackrogersella minutella]